MVHKRCHEKGCTKAPRCEHPWHLKVVHKKQIERGPVDNFAWLLDPGQKLPATKQEALDLEAKVKTWLVRGRPTPTEASSDIRISTLISAAAQDYVKRYVKTELACKHAPSIMKRLIEEKGERPLTDMLSRTFIKDMRDDIAEECSQRTANGYMARWSHFINWSRVEYHLVGTSPFHHKVLNPQGVKQFTGLEGRNRRIEESEEAALRIALLKVREGAMMIGRFDAALDLCIRRGEMLKIEKRDILWKEEKQNGALLIRLRQTNTKSGKERIVPVLTERVLAFLETRRFAQFPFGTEDGSRVETFREEWESALLLSGLESGRYVKGTVGKSKHRNWIKTKDANLHWHDLRHEGASRLLESKQMTIAEIKELLGHSTIEQTMTYLNVKQINFIENMRKAQAGL
jgi:integrase